MSEYELYHHGVKGMKWGVRKKRYEADVERSAKKLANLKTKEFESATKLAGQINLANATNSHGNRKVSREINKSTLQLDREDSKAERFLDKMKRKYENTPYSDITLARSTLNGRTYTHVLIGQVENSPYDGSARYLVTAATATKKR